MMFVDSASGQQYIASGRLRAIAVANRTRLDTLPDVPTLIESGLPDFRGLCLAGPGGAQEDAAAGDRQAQPRAGRDAEVARRGREVQEHGPGDYSQHAQAARRLRPGRARRSGPRWSAKPASRSTDCVDQNRAQAPTMTTSPDTEALPPLERFLTYRMHVVQQAVRTATPTAPTWKTAACRWARRCCLAAIGRFAPLSVNDSARRQPQQGPGQPLGLATLVDARHGAQDGQRDRRARRAALRPRRRARPCTSASSA